VKRSEIGIRDPYILLANGQYYMYGTRNTTAWGPADGFDVYVSDDLEEWNGPIEVFHNDGSFWATENYWAPECIYYRKNYYLIATFGSPDRKKGIQILKSEQPTGPFHTFTDGPLTSEKWNCIDGTVYVDEQGIPWMIFSHGIPEEPRGAMCAAKMKEDLSGFTENPHILFFADEASWAEPIPFAKAEFGLEGDVYFSDGPFAFRADSGELCMIWSSWGTKGYAIGVARSETGSIPGPWKQDNTPLYSENGGHGMILRTRNGEQKLVLHYPNDRFQERAILENITI